MKFSNMTLGSVVQYKETGSVHVVAYIDSSADFVRLTPSFGEYGHELVFKEDGEYGRPEKFRLYRPTFEEGDTVKVLDLPFDKFDKFNGGHVQGLYEWVGRSVKILDSCNEKMVLLDETHLYFDVRALVKVEDTPVSTKPVSKPKIKRGDVVKVLNAGMADVIVGNVYYVQDADESRMPLRLSKVLTHPVGENGKAGTWVTLQQVELLLSAGQEI